MIVDCDGIINFINRTFPEFTHEDIIGANIYDYLSPESKNKYKQTITHIFKTGKSQHIIADEIGPNNTTITYEARIVPLMDSDKVANIMLIATDISSRRRMETVLRENEAQFRQLANASWEAIAIHENGILRHANNQFYDMFGYKPDDLCDKPTVDLIFALESRDLIREKMRTKDYRNYETTGLKKDGSRFNIEIHARNIEYQGRTMRVAAIRDITQRKLAEDALRESEKRFQQLADNVNEGFWMSDAHTGDIIYLNPAYLDIWGRIQPFANFTDWLESIVEDDREQVKRNAAKQHQGENIEEEYHILRPDGQIRCIHDRRFPIRDKNGNVFRIGGIVEDITDEKKRQLERKQLETDMRSMQRLETVGTLVSGVIHDFSNLVTAVTGNVELAKKFLPKNHPVHEQIEMIEMATDQANRITSSLLTFTQKNLEEKIPINLRSITNNSIKLVTRLIPSSVELVIPQTDNNPIWIRGNIGQIQQVLINLVINACDAMPNGGTLSVSVQHVDGPLLYKITDKNIHGHATIKITDTGTGMSQQTIDHAFEPFFTTKQRSKGTGLGLSVVHGIITDHNGYIQIDSHPDQGTTFTIHLPLCHPPKTQAFINPQEIPKKHTLNPIILAENDDYLRSIMATTLESAGYHVVTTNNNTETMNLISDLQKQALLVILDCDIFKTPEIDCLKQIRDQYHNLPVIAVTNSNNHNIANNLGPHDTILAKPFNMEQLIDIVNRVLIRYNRTENDHGNTD